ncbi:MAG: hypothetical protein ACREFU_20720 [Acetobacteraceae bacterium]
MSARRRREAAPRRAERGRVINPCGKRVAGLIVAATLASLGACSAGAPAPLSGGGQAPGTFNVQLHGVMTNAVGIARP